MGDHLVACKWRNNPEIWKYTAAHPNVTVTKEIERRWLEQVLAEKDALRFAICMAATDEYVGNTQLTHIQDNRAQYHMFVGETRYWGRGIAYKATRLTLQEGFRQGLQEIYMYVHKDNKASIHVCAKAGFVEVGATADQIEMSISHTE